MLTIQARSFFLSRGLYCLMGLAKAVKNKTGEEMTRSIFLLSKMWGGGKAVKDDNYESPRNAR